MHLRSGPFRSDFVTVITNSGLMMESSSDMELPVEDMPEPRAPSMPKRRRVASSEGRDKRARFSSESEDSEEEDIGATVNPHSIMERMPEVDGGSVYRWGGIKAVVQPSLFEKLCGCGKCTRKCGPIRKFERICKEACDYQLHACGRFLPGSASLNGYKNEVIQSVIPDVAAMDKSWASLTAIKRALQFYYGHLASQSKVLRFLNLITGAKKNEHREQVGLEIREAIQQAGNADYFFGYDARKTNQEIGKFAMGTMLNFLTPLCEVGNPTKTQTGWKPPRGATDWQRKMIVTATPPNSKSRATWRLIHKAVCLVVAADQFASDLLPEELLRFDIGESPNIIGVIEPVFNRVIRRIDRNRFGREIGILQRGMKGILPRLIKGKFDAIDTATGFANRTFFEPLVYLMPEVSHEDADGKWISLWDKQLTLQTQTCFPALKRRHPTASADQLKLLLQEELNSFDGFKFCDAFRLIYLSTKPIDSGCLNLGASAKTAIPRLQQKKARLKEIARGKNKESATAELSKVTKKDLTRMYFAHYLFKQGEAFSVDNLLLKIRARFPEEFEKAFVSIKGDCVCLRILTPEMHEAIPEIVDQCGYHMELWPAAPSSSPPASENDSENDRQKRMVHDWWNKVKEWAAPTTSSTPTYVRKEARSGIIEFWCQVQGVNQVYSRTFDGEVINTPRAMLSWLVNKIGNAVPGLIDAFQDTSPDGFRLSQYWINDMVHKLQKVDLPGFPFITRWCTHLKPFMGPSNPGFIDYLGVVLAGRKFLHDTKAYEQVHGPLQPSQRVERMKLFFNNPSIKNLILRKYSSSVPVIDAATRKPALISDTSAIKAALVEDIDLEPWLKRNSNHVIRALLTNVAFMGGTGKRGMGRPLDEFASYLRRKKSKRAQYEQLIADCCEITGACIGLAGNQWMKPPGLRNPSGYWFFGPSRKGKSLLIALQSAAVAGGHSEIGVMGKPGTQFAKADFVKDGEWRKLVVGPDWSEKEHAKPYESTKDEVDAIHSKLTKPACEKKYENVTSVITESGFQIPGIRTYLPGFSFTSNKPAAFQTDGGQIPSLEHRNRWFVLVFAEGPRCQPENTDYELMVAMTPPSSERGEVIPGYEIVGVDESHERADFPETAACSDILCSLVYAATFPEEWLQSKERIRSRHLRLFEENYCTPHECSALKTMLRVAPSKRSLGNCVRLQDVINLLNNPEIQEESVEDYINTQFPGSYIMVASICSHSQSNLSVHRYKGKRCAKCCGDKTSNYEETCKIVTNIKYCLN